MTSRVTGQPQLLAQPLDRNVGVLGKQVGDRGFECVELAGSPFLGPGGCLFGAISTGLLDLLQMCRTVFRLIRSVLAISRLDAPPWKRVTISRTRAWVMMEPTPGPSQRPWSPHTTRVVGKPLEDRSHDLVFAGDERFDSTTLQEA